MAPNLKRKLKSFKQWALLISSCGELTTQALANVQSAKSTTSVRLDASTIGGSNSHGEIGAASSEIVGASTEDTTSSAMASSSTNDINLGTAPSECPIAPTLCKKSRIR
jgi:hypothetical protein